MSDFLRKILENMINGKDLPRVQVERQITPFIDEFILQIINSKKKPENYKLVGSEFPIRAKSNDGKNLLSSSIDYLFVNTDLNKLLIVELKTDSNSFKLDQYKNYMAIIDKIKHQNASILYHFLCSLKHEKFKKYKEAIDLKIPKIQWQKIKQCDLIYIAPYAIKSRIWGDKKRNVINEIDFIHFDDMPLKIEGEFSAEWSILREELVKLDTN